MSNKQTPLMQQYFEIKQQHPDTMLLFQVGDFYELFFEDAQTAASFLGIALTKRGKSQGKDIPLCGVPVHALDHYVIKLVRGGFRVAKCDQLEPPQAGKVVKRGVTQVFTPGTLTDERLLDDKAASYLFSFFPLQDSWGLLFAEVLTAQLFATVVTADSYAALDAELGRFAPDEIIVPTQKNSDPFTLLFKKQGYCVWPQHPIATADEQLQRWLGIQFKPESAALVEKHAALKSALATFYAYMDHTNQQALEQFKTLSFYQSEDYLILDSATQRNLELVSNNQNGSRAHTLLSVLDRAMTPMGSRMVKKWLLRPLVKKDMILSRLDAVGCLVEQVRLLQSLKDALKAVGDIERVVGRIALGRATINDYRMLSRSLEQMPVIAHALESVAVPLLLMVRHNIGSFEPLVALLNAAINDDTTKDWCIKTGFDQVLDELRTLVHNSGQKVLALEAQEQEQTGIGSLKIRYNNVQGYYIEVTKANIDAVPERYVVQQTLVGKHRYTIDELRTLEASIMKARAEIEHVEKEVFERVKQDVAEYIGQLRHAAHALAHADALVSFAQCAHYGDYVRPEITTDTSTTITAGRHPVVEQTMSGQFIPNDTTLHDTESLIILTGPNMGGKSTYLRQVALITILAQCGSYVPARSASCAIKDRIFTRIGASDNVAAGKSTFLVEMEETALICRYATQNSLVILDEVGRGTSTFDGLALAQAVVEYLYTTVGARCLFATHYHELTELEHQFPGVVSYYAASKKDTNGLLFLHTICRGVADGSFGIEVAQLADLPDSVITRARGIIEQLKQHPIHHVRSAHKFEEEYHALQRSYAQLKQQSEKHEQCARALSSLDFDDLSPKKAFDLLWQLKELL